MRRYLLTGACISMLLASASHSRSGTYAERPDGRTAAASAGDPHAGSWYFAVSGDSRDCGDLIMPKIARHIADHQSQTPASFYWHLGDFKALYRVDCDMGKREKPSFRCLARDTSPDQTQTMLNQYLAGGAWDDFKKEQVGPFEDGGIPVFLGIGNHELAEGKTRAEYRKAFQRWLRHDWIQAQRESDRQRGIQSLDGDTYYHFVRNGVDFIYLDNAVKNAFLSEEVKWLFKVLDADADDDSVKTIIVGMHDALPGSTSFNHAMDDAECSDVCAARRVYDRLYGAKNLSGLAARRKHVYVFASHSHYIEYDVYNTEDHKGRVVEGWIVGTAGAEQYQESADKIHYGYLLVEVHPDGTVNAQFQEVGRDDPPVPSNGNGITDYCFGHNYIDRPKPRHNKCPKCPPG
jgi:hypothetical protein